MDLFEVDSSVVRVIKPVADYWIYSYGNASGEAVSDDPPSGYAFQAATDITDTSITVNLMKSDPVE